MIKWIVVMAMCAAPSRASTETPMEWKGQYGGPAEAGSEIVRDVKSWKSLWRLLGKNAPPLDLKKFIAVAVFPGERPTGGFTVEFAEPEMKGKDLVVRHRIKAPGGFATQAFTQPWAVRAFPRPKGKAVVEASSP